MKKANVSRRAFSFVVIALAALAAPITGFAQAADPLVVIVNKANTAGADKALVKKMLLGDAASWPTAGKVVIAMPAAGSADRAAILKRLCGMSESDYTRYEMQAAFEGRTAATVHDAANGAAIKAFVKATPGGVGFIRKSESDATIREVLTLE